MSRAYDGAIVSLEIVSNDVGAQPEAAGLEPATTGLTIVIFGPDSGRQYQIND